MATLTPVGGSNVIPPLSQRDPSPPNATPLPQGDPPPPYVTPLALGDPLPSESSPSNTPSQPPKKPDKSDPSEIFAVLLEENDEFSQLVSQLVLNQVLIRVGEVFLAVACVSIGSIYIGLVGAICLGILVVVVVELSIAPAALKTVAIQAMAVLAANYEGFTISEPATSRSKTPSSTKLLHASSEKDPPPTLPSPSIKLSQPRRDPPGTPQLEGGDALSVLLPTFEDMTNLTKQQSDLKKRLEAASTAPFSGLHNEFANCWVDALLVYCASTPLFRDFICDFEGGIQALINTTNEAIDQALVNVNALLGESQSAHLDFTKIPDTVKDYDIDEWKIKQVLNQHITIGGALRKKHQDILTALKTFVYLPEVQKFFQESGSAIAEKAASLDSKIFANPLAFRTLQKIISRYAVIMRLLDLREQDSMTASEFAEIWEMYKDLSVVFRYLEEMKTAAAELPDLAAGLEVLESALQDIPNVKNPDKSPVEDHQQLIKLLKDRYYWECFRANLNQYIQDCFGHKQLSRVNSQKVRQVFVHFIGDDFDSRSGVQHDSCAALGEVASWLSKEPSSQTNGDYFLKLRMRATPEGVVEVTEVSETKIPAMPLYLDMQTLRAQKGLLDEDKPSLFSITVCLQSIFSDVVDQYKFPSGDVYPNVVKENLFSTSPKFLTLSARRFLGRVNGERIVPTSKTLPKEKEPSASSASTESSQSSGGWLASFFNWFLRALTPPITETSDQKDSQITILGRKLSDRIQWEEGGTLTLKKEWIQEKTVQDVRYDLRSFVIHGGDLNGGHYHAYVLCDDQWYHISDSMVEAVPKETALEEAQSAVYWSFEKKTLDL